MDGYAGAGGNIVLDWSFTFNNDHFADAILLTGASGQTKGTNEYASGETNEPDHAGAVADRSVWWKWKPATAGHYTFDTAGSNFDTVLAIYTGSALGNLAPVISNIDGGNISPASRVTFNALANITYYLAVDGSDAEYSDITLNWRAATRPANDNLANAISLTGAGGRATGANVDATFEANETRLIGFGGKSLWWTWESPGKCIVRLNTRGSDFNTILSVYRGSTIANLTAVASNDDEEERDAATSALTFLSEPGVKYYLAVDGYAGAGGNIIFDWGFMSNNDHFADAILLTGTAGRTTGTNAQASSEINEPAPTGSSAYMSVWWKWSVPLSGDVFIDTHGSSFDTMLSVYTGASLTSLTKVADNNDDGSPNRNSGVKFRAQSGTMYYISVDGYRGETGDIVLNWKYPPPGDLNNDGLITLADAIIALRALSGLPPGVSHDLASGDVNGDRRIGLAEAIYILQKISLLR